MKGREKTVFSLADKASSGLSFEQILSDHKDMVFSLCLRVLGDYDDAEDCAQEVFVRIFEKLDSFRGESKLSTWIYRVAYNAALDAARARTRRRKKLISSDCRIEIEDCRRDPEKRMLDMETEDAIKNALMQLQPDQRIALVMCDIEGLPYEEISVITGVPCGTVKSRIARGRIRLRELLGGVL